MASQQGRRGWLALLLLLLGQPCISASAADSTSGGDTILVMYDPQSRQQVLESLDARGYDVLRDLAMLSTLVAKLRPGPAAAAAAAAAAGGVTTAAAQAAALQSAQGIAAAAPDSIIRLIKPVPPTPLETDAPESSGAGRRPGVSTAAAQCTWPDAMNQDYAVGVKEEGRSYGMKMMQADAADIQDIADKLKSRVLYCVMDTGIDVTNQEFTGVALSGAVPDSIADMWPQWDQDTEAHGTHVSGVIAAMRNAKGVAGVSAEGANLFHVRVIPSGTGLLNAGLQGLEQCLVELDRRKAATAVPDMKLVVSMSFGSSSPTAQQLYNAVFNQLTTERSDVLLVAAAGNGGVNGTREFPAGAPQVLAVAAVDANEVVASFSTRQSYVAVAGPGVNIVSTIPLAMTGNNTYYIDKLTNRVTTTPSIPEVTLDEAFLVVPPPEPAEGSISTNVAGPLMSCALALSRCPQATGKICLIQRGIATFRDKVKNCMDAGGIGVLMYNREDLPGCQRLDAITVGSTDQFGKPLPADRVPTMGISRVQGEALLRALQSGMRLTASIRFPALPPQTDIGLGLMSGTSMATPGVAGVAGLVWSAHTACSALQIRAALLATAKMPQGATKDGVPYVKGTRNNDVGVGIVQALAAHQYLLAQPCRQALQVTVLLRPDGVNGTDAKAAALPPNALRTVGQRITLIVKVADADGKKVVGQNVRIKVRPSADLIRCGAYERATNTAGALGIRCKVMKAGRAVVTATVPAGPDNIASTGRSSLTIRPA